MNDNLEKNIYWVSKTMTSNKNDINALFPSARNVSAEATRAQNLDWLENKSFTSETAKKFVQFQQELQELQKKEDNSYGNSGNNDNTLDDDDDDDDDVLKRRDHKHSDTYTRTGQGTVDSKGEIQDIYVKDRPNTHRDKEHEESSGPEDPGHKKRKKRRKYSSSDDSLDAQSKKKKKKHKRKKKRKKERNEATETSIVQIPGVFESNKIFIDDIADIAPDHAFKLDKKPDPNSWTYGSLYSGHLAKYKTACNQCAGLAGNQFVYMIDRDKKKKEKVVSDRYYSKESRRVIQQPPTKVILSSKQDYSEETDIPVFIPVQDINQNTADTGYKDVRQKMLDDSTSLYILGKSKQGGEETEEVPADPLRQKVADYNKRLRESPNDVTLWLDFVKFQDKITIDDSYDITNPDADTGNNKQTARGVLEKKLSILEKALESNPGNIELLLAKTELSSEITDSAQINKELEQLLFVHVANTRLWRYYLTFNQSRLSVFSVSKMTKQYHKCFKTLFRILEGQLQTHSVPQDLEREILEIFLQYCYFLKQAGHKEKAVASFQAQIEYNLFAPPSLNNASRQTKMAAFEGFWDSNCPKIGSAAACGWKNWNEQTNPATEESSSDPLEDIEEALIEKKLPKHDTWLKIEELREQHHWLPWQPGQGQTEEDCEDVERLVVYDDISPVLFDILEHLHFEFIISFLKFLGLQTNSCNCIQLSGYFSENVTELTSNYQGSVDENVVTRSDSKAVKELAIEMLKLAIPCFKDKNRSDLTILLIEIHLSKYHMNSLSKHDKKEMRKLLKNVLKEEKNRHDLAVWSLYIDLERSIGKPGEGENVMETALSMYSGSKSESTNAHNVGLTSLFSQYCEMLLKMEQKIPNRLLPRAAEVSKETKSRVLSVIACLMEGRKFNSAEIPDLTGAGILKTLSSLSRLCNSMCKTISCMDPAGSSELMHEHFIKLMWCHSLFVYCKSGLSTSIDIYTSVIQSLAGGSKYVLQVERRLYLDMFRIISYHMATASSPLHVLRDHLKAALHKFPQDDVFLSLYIDVERKSRIIGRFNSHFDRWCRITEAPTPVMFAILFQLDFLENLKSPGGDTSPSSIIHRSRAWLEHSLAHGTLQHCPLIWRLYLQLEKQAGNSGRLKGVFYRAVQQCPWNKSIYLDGVRLFGAEQLQEIVDLMTEKELRVQIPVEELDILMSS